MTFIMKTLGLVHNNSEHKDTKHNNAQLKDTQHNAKQLNKNSTLEHTALRRSA
jgi:hypothetical protein